MGGGPRALVILGAGGHAKVVADLVLRLAEWRISGLIAADPDADGFFGLPVLGTDACLPKLRRQGIDAAAVAVGDNALRMRLGALAKRHGFMVPTLCHPAAVVSAFASLAEGAVVMAGASVGPAARVGPFAIVNTRAVVEHDCEVGEGAHIAPCAALGGGVRVGARSLVGIGAAVRPGVQIGSDAVVGAGATVVADVPKGVTVIGTPAKPRGSAMARHPSNTLS